MSFQSLGLSTALYKTLEAQKFKSPYPIQRAAIPTILEKKDVLGIAKTGSGKTASYVLPILSNLQEVSSFKNRMVNVLVLVPTRELAEQVREVFRVFADPLPKTIKSMAVYGGVSINPQMKALYGINVLIATPGRLLELVESKAVILSGVETLVLDEADKMLNLGFKEEMKQIFDLLPSKRQNLLFSATLSEDVDSMKQVLLHDPKVIKIETLVKDPELINETGYFVSDERKGPLLRYLINNKEMKQVLVFASSGSKVDKITEKLKKNGIDAAGMHGKKSQGSRLNTLEKFKSGRLQVLVATDLLSRGIDIAFLPYVINYELPRSPKDYIHRIGRTGRAEAPGEAISLITPDEQHHFRVIQKKRGKWVTMIESESLEF